MGQKLTGLSAANVRTGTERNPGVVLVLQGEDLPDDLFEGEQARLEKLGAFGDPPQRDRTDQIRAEQARLSDGSEPTDGRRSPRRTRADAADSADS